MKKRNFVFIVSLFAYLSVFGQTNSDPKVYPEVGKQCPDFALHNIQNYSRKEASLKDFSGKWLIIDFWDKDCGACVASFPKMSALQKEFAGKVQIMLVGLEDVENQIKPMYAKYQKRLKLVMPSSFDSSMFRRFAICTVPHLWIIDPNGMVKGVTNAIHEEDIKAFLAGKTPVLARTYKFCDDTTNYDALEGFLPYDPKRPLLIGGNGGVDSSFLFRSILSKFDPAKYHVSRVIDDYDLTNGGKEGKVQFLGVHLATLYNEAYFASEGPIKNMEDSTYGKRFGFGKRHDCPILEIKDSSQFQYSYRPPVTNLFSYSLIMPVGKTSKALIRATMQQDLKNCFGYSAAIETRKCPYWKLIVIDPKKIVSHEGGTLFFEGSIAGFKAKNYPMKYLCGIIHGALQNELPVLLDETGIKGTIDITMDCVLTEFDDVKKTLRKNGLDLVQGEKDMQVLVIKDKP